jgi:hypothetical protein
MFSIKESVLYYRTWVGKVRPPGRIRPAKTGVSFSTHASYSSCNIVICLFFEKGKKNHKTARGPKKLATPAIKTSLKMSTIVMKKNEKSV